MCNDSMAGFSFPDDKKIHAASAFVIALSGENLMNSGEMDYSMSCVEAGDARKAEDASIYALVIPSAPCLTGATVCHLSPYST